MDKSNKYILVRKTHVVEHLLEKGYGGKYITNIKLDDQCRECKRTGVYKCGVCEKYHGYYHLGFAHADEIEEEIEKFYNERKKRYAQQSEFE